MCALGRCARSIEGGACASSGIRDDTVELHVEMELEASIEGLERVVEMVPGLWLDEKNAGEGENPGRCCIAEIRNPSPSADCSLDLRRDQPLVCE
jgi:hypothetical protein